MKEAKLLLDNKCFEGAYYLAGYAVEGALKACIARKTQLYEFPPKPDVVRNFYQHDIASLANLAGLQEELKYQQQSVIQFSEKWRLVTRWSEQHRYETRIGPKDARDLYRAIANSRSGVLIWLKKYW